MALQRTTSDFQGTPRVAAFLDRHQEADPAACRVPAAVGRPTARYLRNGALASLGLYSVIILVLLALTGGFQHASQAEQEPDDKSALFQRLDEALPVALGVLQRSLRPRS